MHANMEGFRRDSHIYVCMYVHIMICVDGLNIYCSQVFQWTHETIPDQRKPLDTYYNESTGRLCSYQLEVCMCHSMCMANVHTHI